MGAVFCFLLFLAAVGLCILLGQSLILAIWVGIAAFAALGLRRGMTVRAMWDAAWEQGRKMCCVIVIYMLIGAITALWRSAGTIAFFIYHGLRIITPQLFLLVTFLLTSFISYALGTSFGVVGTLGVILMALARSGGGMMSMVSATIMAVSAGLYAGLLGGMGVLNGAAHLAQRLARRAGRFPACVAISVVCSMVFCNQSTCAVVCNQLLEDDYTKRGHGRGEMALDIENSGIVLSPLIPWNISVSIPLAMLGADMSAIPYEILLYAIPLCYWLTKRRVYPPKGDDCYDTIAEPLVHS